jgi:hypothetical protein
MLPPSHDPTCAFHSGSENLNLVLNYIMIQDVYKLLYPVQETTLQNGNTARLLLLKVEVKPKSRARARTVAASTELKASSICWRVEYGGDLTVTDRYEGAEIAPRFMLCRQRCSCSDALTRRSPRRTTDSDTTLPHAPRQPNDRRTKARLSPTYVHTTITRSLDGASAVRVRVRVRVCERGPARVGHQVACAAHGIAPRGSHAPTLPRSRLPAPGSRPEARARTSARSAHARPHAVPKAALKSLRP